MIIAACVCSSLAGDTGKRFGQSYPNESHRFKGENSSGANVGFTAQLKQCVWEFVFLRSYLAAEPQTNCLEEGGAC